MVVRLLFICFLSPKLCCETVRVRGTALENLLVYYGMEEKENSDCNKTKPVEVMPPLIVDG